MGTFAISSPRFYFVRNGFGFRTEISDANRLLLLCRSLLLLLRWECTWCCWRGLWLTRHVFGIESYDLRATVYVLYTTCVLKGRFAMWNESEVQSSEPTSVRPGLMSASWFQVVSWLATKLRGGKSRKDDMETWYLHIIFTPDWVMTAGTALYIQKQCEVDFNLKGKLCRTILELQ